MKRLSNSKWPLTGILLGGLGGFIYWNKVGCLTGTCPLKSQWQTMVPYGMMLGYLITTFVRPLPR